MHMLSWIKRREFCFFPHPPSPTHTMSKRSTVDRSWWRKLFEDHPGTANKTPDSFDVSETGKTRYQKVYCTACLSVDVDQIIMEDQGEIHGGGHQVAARTRPAIIAYCE